MMDSNFTTISNITTNQLTQITNGDLNIPSSEGSLGLTVPPTDFEAMCRDLLRSGDISSDGEFSAIARKEIETKGYTLPVAQDWIKQESSHKNQTGINPSTQNWAGDLNFDLRIPPAVKSKDAQHSSTLNKLYINQNRSVNIIFTVKTNNANPLPPYLEIRGLVIYVVADDFREPVKVCYTHSRNSDGSLRTELSEHLLRCIEEDTCYDQDFRSDRHSVRTAIPHPQAGSDEVQLAYKFMDLGSCSGGLNRREVAVIFTLELAGNVIGRKVLPVRICTCPKRDMETDEKHHEMRKRKKNMVNGSVPSPTVNTVLNNTPIRSDGDKKVLIEKRNAYWVLAYGEENYETLRTMGEALERKDTGDSVRWQEEMKKMNQGSKRKRLQDDDSNPENN